MSRLLFITLFATAAATGHRREDPPKLPKVTSFDMSCYMVNDPEDQSEEGAAKGRSYRGLVTFTASGRTCKNWVGKNPWTGANQTAIADREVDGVMKWGNGIGNHNYCRNPTPKTMNKPWCFTTDPKVPKEECSIDPCPKPVDYTNDAKQLAAKIKSTDCGEAGGDCLYGSSATTADTRVKFLQSASAGSGREDPEDTPKLPKITSFEMSCYEVEDPYDGSEVGAAKGQSYRGLVTFTASGRTCANWIGNHKWEGGATVTATADRQEKGVMHWGNGLGNHNYCRNPDKSMDTPWCFTVDSKVPKEACSIPKCKKPVNYVAKAKKLKETMKTIDLDCKCREQLYGSTATTKDTRVKFLQTARMGRTKDGKPCECQQ